MKPCDICLEKECKEHTCNCEKCDKKHICYRFLKPIIKITNKCTQSCSHCCFESNPEDNMQMTIQTASVLKDFLLNNEIATISIMGGEFFCNPSWFEIFSLLIPAVSYARLVTNGDWATNEQIPEKLLDFKDKIKISISKDRWHTNKNVNKAISICKKLSFKYDLPTEEETSENSIVPIGRSSFSYSFYSTFSTYCSNPAHMYSFLINEKGQIFKCGFGILNYANIFEYQKGDFCKRFKEFNKEFYEIPIYNCSQCIRALKKLGQ